MFNLCLNKVRFVTKDVIEEVRCIRDPEEFDKSKKRQQQTNLIDFRISCRISSYPNM